MHVHYAQHKPAWICRSELDCLCSPMVQHTRDEPHPGRHLHSWHVHGQDICTADTGCADMQLGRMHVCGGSMFALPTFVQPPCLTACLTLASAAYAHV